MPQIFSSGTLQSDRFPGDLGSLRAGQRWPGPDRSPLPPSRNSAAVYKSLREFMKTSLRLCFPSHRVYPGTRPPRFQQVHMKLRFYTESAVLLRRSRHDGKESSEISTLSYVCSLIQSIVSYTCNIHWIFSNIIQLVHEGLTDSYKQRMSGCFLIS